MDQKTLVDQDIDAGADLINALYAAGFGVALAFWVYNTRIGDWRLFVATPEIRERGRAQSYRIVQEVISNTELPPALDLSKIVLVSDTDPIIERLRSLAENPEFDSLGIPFDQEIFDRESRGEGFLYKTNALRFEHDVALALQRVSPPGAVIKANSFEADLEHDFIIEYRDSIIIVEVKATAKPLAGWTVERILRMHSRRGQPLLIISKSGFTQGSRERMKPHTTPVRLVKWVSPTDDGVLREALAALLGQGGHAELSPDP